LETSRFARPERSQHAEQKCAAALRGGADDAEADGAGKAVVTDLAPERGALLAVDGLAVAVQRDIPPRSDDRRGAAGGHRQGNTARPQHDLDDQLLAAAYL